MIDEVSSWNFKDKLYRMKDCARILYHHLPSCVSSWFCFLLHEMCILVLWFLSLLLWLENVILKVSEVSPARTLTLPFLFYVAVWIKPQTWAINLLRCETNILEVTQMNLGTFDVGHWTLKMRTGDKNERNFRKKQSLLWVYLVVNEYTKWWRWIGQDFSK